MLMLLRARARRLLLRQKSTALPQRRPLPQGPSFADFCEKAINTAAARGDAEGHARPAARRPDGFVSTLPRLPPRVAHRERCNLRCRYCMPAEGISDLTPSHELLTTKEVERVINVFARAGASKVRLTGGEPTLRRDLDICAAIKRDNPGVKSLGLTTNGMKLLSRSDGVRLVDALAASGVDSVNISLDSLDAGRFLADDAAARFDPQTGAGCDRRVCFVGPERQGQLRGTQRRKRARTVSFCRKVGCVRESPLHRVDALLGQRLRRETVGALRGDAEASSALGAAPSSDDTIRRNGGPLAARPWASSRPCPSTSAGVAIACA